MSNSSFSSSFFACTIQNCHCFKCMHMCTYLSGPSVLFWPIMVGRLVQQQLERFLVPWNIDNLDNLALHKLYRKKYLTVVCEIYLVEENNITDLQYILYWRILCDSDILIHIYVMPQRISCTVWSLVNLCLISLLLSYCEICTDMAGLPQYLVQISIDACLITNKQMKTKQLHSGQTVWKDSAEARWF